MRIALISDLHGNYIALRAVLDEIARARVDRTICLGDVATLGPHPEYVVEAVAELGCPVILGNHDEFMLDPDLIHSYTEAPIVVDAVEWCRARLTHEHRAFLETFVPTLEMPLDDGGATLFLFHGSPRSHMDILLATTPDAEVDSLLGSRRALVMAGGHTHLQMLRQHHGQLLVNPGSVGLPFESVIADGPPTVLAHAEFAIVEYRGGAVEVSLRRVPLERAALRAAIEDSDNPIRRDLLVQYA